MIQQELYNSNAINTNNFGQSKNMLKTGSVDMAKKMLVLSPFRKDKSSCIYYILRTNNPQFKSLLFLYEKPVQQVKSQGVDISGIP